MKNIYSLLIVAVAAILPLCEAAAQNRKIEQGDITVQTNRLEQCGDSLYIDLLLTTRGQSVASRKSADFTPVLASETQRKRLPTVSVKGRSNYKTYRRSVALMSKREKAVHAYTEPYEVVRDYKRGDERVDYKLAIPYEKWMDAARLELEKDDCGCGESHPADVKLLASKVELEEVILIERYNITPSLAYIQPEVEPVKQRATTVEAFLDFAVGQSILRPDSRRNPQELDKIRAMINDVKGDKDVTLRQITITGYASPEGSLASNKKLAESRALRIKTYLMGLYDYPQSLYNVHFGGEDWEGLAKLVRTSEMEHKQQVLNIIESVEILDGREAQLKALAGGNPWRYMLREMFPSLRRVNVVGDYNVANFDLEQARKVVATRPQNLSQNEMYAVAQTYEKGSQEFNDLFETAVRMFPGDATANVNAAVAALERRDYVSVERYLKNVKTKQRIPEYENAMGVLVMMRDADYDKAAEYFKSAQQAGIVAAGKNLEEIAKMRENINRIKEAELKSRK